MLGNLVLETCNAPGTAADCLLLGPATGRLPFSFWFANGAACFYILADGAQEEWGIGTYHTGSPNRLTRTTVIRNSAGSTARLNFLGTTRVYNDIPAERSLWVDNSNNVRVPGAITATDITLARAGDVRVNWQDATRPLNEKNWDAVATGSQLLFRSVSDSFTAWQEWCEVHRSGYAVTGITFRATNGITFYGNISLQGALATLGDVQVGGAVYFSTINAGTAFRIWSGGSNRTIEFTPSPGWNLVFDARPAVNNLNYFNNSGTPLFWSEGSSGNFYVNGNVIASNVSDERTKRDVAPFARGLAEIIALQPVTYYYNGLGGTTDTGEQRIGMIAQDVQPYFPEMVYETTEAPRDPANVAPDPRLPGQLSLNERPLLFALANAVRELSDRIVALEGAAVKGVAP